MGLVEPRSLARWGGQLLGGAAETISVTKLEWIWISLAAQRSYGSLFKMSLLLFLTLQGSPSCIGNVKLFWLRLSLAGFLSSLTSSKSNSRTIFTIAYAAMSSAILFPRQDRGPPLKTGKSKALLPANFPCCSHLSGSKVS